MSFLSQAFQATTAENQNSVISFANSSTDPLPYTTPSALNFEGAWVSGANYSTIQMSIFSDTNCVLYVEQSFFVDGRDPLQTFTYFYRTSTLPTLETQFAYITCPFVRVVVANESAGNTVFFLSTKLTSSQSSSVNVNNFPEIQPVSGTVAVSSVAGSVATTVSSLPPITGTVAVSSLPAVTGTVAVSSVAGSVATTVSSLPAITGTVAVSSLPAVTGTVAVSSVTGKVETSLYGTVPSYNTTAPLSAVPTDGPITYNQLAVFQQAIGNGRNIKNSSCISFGEDSIGDCYPIPLVTSYNESYNVSELRAGQEAIVENVGDADWSDFTNFIIQPATADSMQEGCLQRINATVSPSQIAYGWDMTLWGASSNEEDTVFVATNIPTQPFPSFLPTEYYFTITPANYGGAITYEPELSSPSFGADPSDTLTIQVFLNPYFPLSVVPYVVEIIDNTGAWSEAGSLGTWTLLGTLFNGLVTENDLTFLVSGQGEGITVNLESETGEGITTPYIYNYQDLAGASFTAIGAGTEGTTSTVSANITEPSNVFVNTTSAPIKATNSFTRTPATLGSVPIKTFNNKGGTESPALMVYTTAIGTDKSQQECSTVSYGIDDDYNLYPIPLTIDGAALKTVINQELPAGTNTIGSVINFVKSPTNSLSVTALGITAYTLSFIQGVIIQFSPVNQGASGTIAWYKFYNKINATSSDYPMFTYGVSSSLTNTISPIPMFNLYYSTALSVRVTLNYAANDNTPPLGVQSMVCLIGQSL